MKAALLYGKQDLWFRQPGLFQRTYLALYQSGDPGSRVKR
jgi:hypothetical protein